MGCIFLRTMPLPANLEKWIVGQGWIAGRKKKSGLDVRVDNSHCQEYASSSKCIQCSYMFNAFKNPISFQLALLCCTVCYSNIDIDLLQKTGAQKCWSICFKF